MAGKELFEVYEEAEKQGLFLSFHTGLHWHRIADYQMHAFRKSGKGGFIRDGLWKNSRHPNYLGEILMWWGIGISAVSTLGWGYSFLVIGAVANTALFLFVSIPLAEGKQAKKEGYAEYKAQTRALLPIAKKTK